MRKMTWLTFLSCCEVLGLRPRRRTLFLSLSCTRGGGCCCCCGGGTTRGCCCWCCGTWGNCCGLISGCTIVGCCCNITGWDCCCGTSDDGTKDCGSVTKGDRCGGTTAVRGRRRSVTRGCKVLASTGEAVMIRGRWQFVLSEEDRSGDCLEAERRLEDIWPAMRTGEEAEDDFNRGLPSTGCELGAEGGCVRLTVEDDPGVTVYTPRWGRHVAEGAVAVSRLEWLASDGWFDWWSCVGDCCWLNCLAWLGWGRFWPTSSCPPPPPVGVLASWGERREWTGGGEEEEHGSPLQQSKLYWRYTQHRFNSKSHQKKFLANFPDIYLTYIYNGKWLFKGWRII